MSKMGRPPKRSEEVKRRAFAFRATDNLHARIAADAAAGQRSVAEEVTRRLEQSYELGDLRILIREEIRAALAERDEARPDADGFVPVTPRSGFIYRY